MANGMEDVEREINDFQAFLGELRKEDEKEVKKAVGKDNFRALQVFAFEYACKMAEALGIYKNRGKEREKYQFLQICHGYRRFVLNEIFESLYSSKERYHNKRITLPSNKELDEIVEKEYTRGRRISFVLTRGSLVYVSQGYDGNVESA